MPELNLEIVPSELAIVIVAAICTGAFLKSTKKIADEIIPMIVLVETVAFTVFFRKSFDVESVMLGIICAAIAVFGKNVQKQLQKMKEKNKIDTAA